MIVRRCLCGIALLVAPLAAHASEWKLIVRIEAPPSALYADMKTFREEKGTPTVRAWVRSEQDKPLKFQGRDVKSMRMLFQVDCNQLTYQILAGAAVDINGKAIKGEQPIMKRPEYFVPNTSEGVIAQFLCDQRFWEQYGPPVVLPERRDSVSPPFK